MQGLADGYFVLPQTIGNFFATHQTLDVNAKVFEAAEQATSGRLEKLLALDGERTVESVHRDLGRTIWKACGMSRTREGLQRALQRLPQIRDQFWTNTRVAGRGQDLNMSLEKAGRIADLLELGELMCRDALAREESCGCHFREEYQTAEGEAQRNDEQFSHVAAWQFEGEDAEPTRHTEALTFEEVMPSQRSYK